MALDSRVRPSVLRLAVNLARFTKTRVCLSCFGSANLGHSANFQSSDGLFNLGCLFLFVLFPFHPLISLSLCISGAPMEPLALFSDTTPTIRCISPIRFLPPKGVWLQHLWLAYYMVSLLDTLGP